MIQIKRFSKEREEKDLYCTNPIAIQMLLDNESFDINVWECCNGLGHITNVLKENGYKVRKSDVVNYNGDDTEIIDILNYNESFNGDIVTNPPYRLINEVTKKCLALSKRKVAFYTSLSFLASQTRKPLFQQFPPKTIYIMSKRLSCAKNGDFSKVNGTTDYCWVVWDKNYKGDTFIKWL